MQYSCSKTIFDSPEVELAPGIFCQPIDIGIDLQGNQTIPIQNMDQYPFRSQENAKDHIAGLLELGIRSVMIRMDSPAAYPSTRKLLERQAAIIKGLREAFPELSIIVDPFSVALNQDKTWGVLKDGKLDYEATATLFGDISETFTQSDASYVLTLGRFEREVAVAKQAVSGATKVSSFSTNTETTNAYVYSDHGAYALTKQKILVSNFQEMIFRALVDTFEGSEMVIVKPAENLHVLEKLTMLLSHPDLLTEFLKKPRVIAMANTSKYLKSVHGSMLADQQGFLSKAKHTRIAAYTVSGTYFMDMQTLRRKGSYFLTSVLHERFSNIAAVLDEASHPSLIIDRNAAWYINNRT
jgi:delta-aminolevulinic acid dehydratase/porphobilinogen synthase